MRKKGSELKKGYKIVVGGKVYIIEEFEISDIGKQGKRKCRIVAKADDGEKITLVRPEDYPFECD